MRYGSRIQPFDEGRQWVKQAKATVTWTETEMAFTDINSEDRLVQKTFAGHLRDLLPRLMSGEIAV